MLTKSNKSLRILTVLALTATLITAGYFTSAWANPMGAAEHDMMRPEAMREFMQARLDKAAERLEIKASQQSAWDEYAKAVIAMADQKGKQPDRDADAATVARYRAEMLSELSTKMNNISDATAKLQAVLTDDQRKTFNLIARNAHHGGYGWDSSGKFCHGKQHGGYGWGHPHDDKSQQGGDAS